MKASRALIFALLPLAFAPMQAAAAPNPVLEVNPFIGTTITYDKTDVIDDFPGADLPFGMVQWSPDTPTQNAGGGYEYSDKAITGFSLTHLSGPGCSVFGDFGILPTTGAVTAPASASQPFSHVGEVAVPGYYAVTLGDPGIRAQLTVTKRTGLGSFTFPRAAQANLLFNASSDQSGVSDAGIHVIGNNEIAGYATTGHFCGMPNVYSVYFVAQFDRPFSSYGTWKGARVQAGSAQTSGAGSGGWVSFDASSRPVVEMKVGLSFVSEAGALANLRAENRGWDIVAVRNAAAATWQRILGRIAVQGGTPDEQHIFYTALYHALLHPNVDSDVTGQYPGFDGATHRVAQGHAEYANFSGWDIYRTQATLMALLAPRQASDAGQSLVDAAEQGGWLPKWPVVNGYSAVMAGDPADTILATYFAFGARGFDTRAALAAMVKGATDEPRHAPGQGWYVDRLADDEYLQRGYVVNSHTTNVSPVPNGASETLEYAIADFSLAQFARSLGAMSVYHRALRRSQNWANVFDTATGLIAPRDAQGAFMQTPITPDGQSGFQEGNSAQYTWMTQQDYRDLIRGMGGPAATIRKLDTYFSQRNAGQSKPYAWMGNEPSIGDPFVYLAAGEPWRAQQVLRDVQTTQWFNLPQGLCGNDDLGTMSAWYVWNAIGLYPENPAVRGFAIGTPLFTRAVVRPPHGPAIEIDAPGASDSAMYIQSLQVNGRSSQRSWIALPQSGTLRLHFVMGSAPNTAWGTQPQDAPPSYTETPVTFPRATLAALVPRTVDAAVGAGDAASIAFEVTNARAATPVSVRWRAVSPAGIRTIPDSGSVTVPAGGSTTVSAMLSGASLAPGYYDVAIDASTSDGAVLHHIDAVASVGAATQIAWPTLKIAATAASRRLTIVRAAPGRRSRSAAGRNVRASRRTTRDCSFSAATHHRSTSSIRCGKASFQPYRPAKTRTAWRWRPTARRSGSRKATACRQSIRAPCTRARLFRSRIRGRSRLRRTARRSTS